jgi:enolase
MPAKIKKIQAREIIDSRGWPTAEVVVTLDNGLMASSSYPNSVSAINSSFEKKDADSLRYQGQGVKLAIQNIEDKIAPLLIGLSPLKQTEIDQLMIKLDDTEDKKNIGVNAILAVSLAVARVAALSLKLPLYEYLNQYFFDRTKMSLPAPIMTMFNGGYYADTNLDFEEYLLVLNATSSRFNKNVYPFAEMLRAGVETYHCLGTLLEDAGYDTDTGLEGAYAPDMDSSLQALELIMAASMAAGYNIKQDAGLGVDIGSSVLYDEESKKYIFSLDGNHFSTSHLVGLYNEWLSRFPLVYLEDSIAPEDVSGWRQVSEELNNKLILAGGDFFASRIDRLRLALKDGLANSIVISPSQVGTLTETVECLKLARRHNYQIIISSRPGETNDDFIADLAVASAANYFKGGAPVRGERVAKWNRLLEIEKDIYGK